MSARFGPAGSADSFHAMGYRKTSQMPEYLEKMGLNAFEYQCGRGVRISREAARELGDLSREKGIVLSLHAPYFISLSSPEEEKRDKSIDYILQSAVAADAMGADRIVVHSGSCSKMTRDQALDLGELRQRWSAPELIGKLAWMTGLRDDFEPITARELIGEFAWSKVQREPIVVTADFSEIKSKG